MGFLISYLANMNKDSVTQIAVYDQAGLLKNHFKSDKHTTYIDISTMPLKAAKDTAKASYEGLIYVPNVSKIQDLKAKVEYISDESPSIEFIETIEDVVDSTLTQENFKTSGIDTKAIEKATVESELKLSKYSGDESLKGLNEIKVAIGGFLVI